MAEVIKISEDDFQKYAKILPKNFLFDELQRTMDAIWESNEFTGAQVLLFQTSEGKLYFFKDEGGKCEEDDQVVYSKWALAPRTADYGKFYVIPKWVVNRYK